MQINKKQNDMVKTALTGGIVIAGAERVINAVKINNYAKSLNTEVKDKFVKETVKAVKSASEVAKEIGLNVPKTDDFLLHMNATKIFNKEVAEQVSKAKNIANSQIVKTFAVVTGAIALGKLISNAILSKKYEPKH